MEGLGGEDVLATAMSAISLAAEKVSKTDLVSRIAQMQATIDSLSIKNKKLEEDIDTLVHIMYINMYSNENRFIGATRFCKKIIDAHKTMCLRFAGAMGIPANPDDIASDIDGVKRSLKDFATMKERDFITRMFCSA